MILSNISPDKVLKRQLTGNIKKSPAPSPGKTQTKGHDKSGATSSDDSSQRSESKQAKNTSLLVKEQKT